jgi:hypothetical protein
MKETLAAFLLWWVPEGLLTRHLTRRLKDKKRPVLSQSPRQREQLSGGTIARTLESKPDCKPAAEAEFDKAVKRVDEAVALLTLAKRNLEDCLNSRNETPSFDTDADAKIELMTELNQSILQG